MPATIRPCTAADRAAMVTVYCRAIREGAAAFYSEAERAAWATSAVPNPDKPDKLADQWCYVAAENTQLTGFMSMEPQGHLDMAFVLPEVMGNGTAAALYETLMAHARAGGCATSPSRPRTNPTAFWPGAAGRSTALNACPPMVRCMTSSTCP